MDAMRAMIMDALAEPLEVREVEAPSAPTGGVVVEVHATGCARATGTRGSGTMTSHSPTFRGTSWRA